MSWLGGGGFSGLFGSAARRRGGVRASKRIEGGVSGLETTRCGFDGARVTEEKIVHRLGRGVILVLA